MYFNHIKIIISFFFLVLMPIYQAQATAPSIVYVDDGYTDIGVDDGHTWGVDAFATIQNGINAVDTAGTVNVAAGTYTETITVNKALILIGDIGDGSVGAGPDAPLVIPNLDTKIIIINANNVTVKGLIVKGSDTPNEGTTAVWISPNRSGILIQNNEIRNSRNGLDLTPNSHDNIVTLNKFDAGFYIHIGGSTNNLISYNEIYGNYMGIWISTGGGGGSVPFSNTVGGNTISHNNIHDNISGGFGGYGSGIGITEDALDVSAGPISIDSNTITANEKSGINVRSLNVTDVVITNNTITGNNTGNIVGLAGIKVVYALGSTIHNNVISGNLGAGVINEDVVNDLDATGNFWGDESGPFNASTNAGGLGDVVSDHVIYDPFWQYSSVADTVFTPDATVVSGASVTVVSSGSASNAIWFAPEDTTVFVAGPTMTTAAGDATTILAPATAGDYKMFVIDSAGNISNPSAATLTVSNPAPPPAPHHRRASSGGSSAAFIRNFLLHNTVSPPTDCLSTYNFSPSTGQPCPVSTPSISSGPPPMPQCTITLTLKLGNRGDQVKCLQTILNVPLDGVFGPKTKAAVIIFQKSEGLVPDGIVGPKTGAMLI